MDACFEQMIDEVADALDHLEGARAIVLTGEGRAFCSGAASGPTLAIASLRR